MQGVVEVICLNHCQHGSKDFFLGDACMRVYICEHGWLDKVTWAVMSATGYETAFMLAYLDIPGDLLHGVLIDDRAHIGLRFSDVAHAQLLRLVDHFLQYLVVDLPDNDGTRACGTLLPLETKGGSDNAPAAASRSAVSSTTTASLPPISKTARFSQSCPLC